MTRESRHPRGRPPCTVDPEEVCRLRDQGLSWRQVARELDIGTATAMRLRQQAARASQNSRPAKERG